MSGSLLLSPDSYREGFLRSVPRSGQTSRPKIFQQKTHLKKGGSSRGSSGWARTNDPLINSQML